MKLYCIDCGAPIEYAGRGPHPKRCPECNKLYRKEYNSAREKTDKVKAVRRKYRESEKSKAYQKEWWTTQAGKEASSRSRSKRRSKMHNVEHEPWTREEIIKRDNGICQICGLPIYDYDDSPSRLKPEIDHVKPISAGGADKIDNLQLTHSFCNQHKHDGDANIKYCKSVISSELEALAEKLL